MFQLLLLIFTLIVPLLIYYRQYRQALVISSLNLFISISISLGPIPKILLSGLQVYPQLTEPQWKNRNLIILLGAGAIKWSAADFIRSQNTAYSRIHEAARLYFDCKSKSEICQILSTGGNLNGYSISEAEIMQKELVEIGVNKSDVITETESTTTFENAQLSSPIIQKEKFEYLVLVTSGFHMKRALYSFTQFGIKATPAPSDYLSIKTTWKYLHHNFYIADICLHEYIGSIKYYILFNK